MGGAAVLDRETGLVWASNASPCGRKIWQDALDCCRTRTFGYRKGWKLPTVEQLSSLIGMSEPGYPKLPEGFGDYFVQVQNEIYWTSTTHESNNTQAMALAIYHGQVYTKPKTHTHHVWPVRGDNDG
jgi:hypothetical protein